jgi:AAA domain
MARLSKAFSSSSASVNFPAVKAATIPAAERLASRWLPHGKRIGDEWVATNPTRSDSKPGSFKVNLVTGLWADFATGETGGDMIDLYVYLFGGDALNAAKELGNILGVPLVSNVARLHTVAPGVVKPTVTPLTIRVRELMAPEQSQRDPDTFPPRTAPDRDGKPRFVVAGDEGPPAFSDEKRRHYYKAGCTPIKIKVMRKNGDALIWYRVSDGDVTGWQLRKPVGFRGLAFIGHLDPFDPERIDEPVYWPEGEKDTDSVTAKGALALTFGGVGDGLPTDCEVYLAGRDVIILADNDAPGRKHAEEKAALAFSVGASVRVVHFTEVPHKGDVSDYFQLGRTLQDLQQIVSLTMPYKPRVAPLPEAAAEAPQQRLVIKATPYLWTDPKTIPRRDFIYGKHLIRKFVSATVAPGGVGKSSLEITEALAMVSGIDLLGVRPSGRSKVWLWNLEDPAEEITRHIQATAAHYRLNAQHIDGCLFIDSGRDTPLVIATTDRSGTMIVQPVVDALVAEIKLRGVDVLIIDPFVSSHEAPENDNGAMDRIIKAWGRVADLGNCAVELVHHSRKSSAGETEITVESSRGGKALTDGCRSVRVLNRMSKEEGENAGVDAPRVHFRTFIDKSNLAPPAEASTWFKLQSVDLGNGETGFGDSVGVVVSWTWPDLMADVTVSDLQAVQAIISKGRYRASPQAEEWVGNAVAEALKLDLTKAADKRKATNLLRVWLASGALKKVEEKDDKGMSRPFVVVGVWAND